MALAARLCRCHLPLRFVLARSRDPFKRVEISLCTESGREVEAMAVLPKPVGERPVVIFLHDARGSLLRSGNDLGRFAEMGLAAVGMEYDQASQTNFNEEMAALCRFVQRQRWARTNEIAWVGFSLGAQRSLSFALTQPNHQPNLMVRVAAGWVGELESEFTVQSSRFKVNSPGKSATGQHSTLNTQPSTLNPQPDQSLLTSAATRSSGFLLVHGEKDRTFPLADNERLAGLLRSNGVPVRMIVLADQGHAFAEDRPVVMRGVAEYVAEFFGSPPRVGTNDLPPNWAYWIPVFAMMACGIVWGGVRLVCASSRPLAWCSGLVGGHTSRRQVAAENGLVARSTRITNRLLWDLSFSLSPFPILPCCQTGETHCPTVAAA